LLEQDGIYCNVVSVISEGLFRDQEPGYQQEVLGDVPRFGLTAGLPINLLELTGTSGKIFGLEHFGFSAPAGVLDEHFGFTGEQVAQQIKSFIDKLSA